MSKKDIIALIKKGELSEKEYSKITPFILSSLSASELKKLNPNYLYHINRQTLINIDEKTFNKLYKIALESTLEKTVTRKVSNLGGEKVLKYKKNINTYYFASMLEARFTKKYNINKKEDEVNQEFCLESGLISSQDIYKLLNVNFVSRKNIEESGILKRVMGENNGGSSVYYDYKFFLKEMNKSFVRGERDTISPKKFDKIPVLLKKKDIREIYGQEYFTAIANFVNQIFDYISYFKISERMVLYPKYIIDAVYPIVLLNAKEREEKGKRNQKYSLKEYKKRDKLMRKEYEKIKKKED